MDLNAYLDWVVANFTTDEGRAFMAGLGLGVFVVMIRWGLRLLNKGGKMLW